MESKYKSNRPIEQSNPNDCSSGSYKVGGKLGRRVGAAEGSLVLFNRGSVGIAEDVSVGAKASTTFKYTVAAKNTDLNNIILI